MPAQPKSDIPLPGIGVKAIRCEKADEGTVDCSLFCLCDDGSEYAVKDANSDPRIPHSEWLCTRLGEIVGLVSPQCKIVEVNGGEWFGSRWSSGKLKDWWLSVENGTISFSDIAPSLSRIFAFDLFIQNEDRHLNNYIIRHQRTSYVVEAFDYSQAWLCNGIPPLALPMRSDSKTILSHRFLAKSFGFSPANEDVRHVLKNLASVTQSDIERIIQEHPKFWLIKEEHAAIIDWWKSPARTSRIAQIAEGIADGSLL